MNWFKSKTAKSIITQEKIIIDKISPSGLDVSRGLKDKNNDISLIKLNELRISLSAA